MLGTPTLQLSHFVFGYFGRQVPSTKVLGHGGIPKVTFPERQKISKFADGLKALVVISIFALELETEAALVLLLEQAAQIHDVIHPADLFGGAVSSP